jgi:hypothetical protein
VKLADLRKLAIRRQTRIRFRLRNGQECVITEHGVAQVAALRGIPDFNLEEELASAASFLLDPVVATGKKGPKGPPPGPEGAHKGTPVGREELAGMASGGSAADAPHEDD